MRSGLGPRRPSGRLSDPFELERFRSAQAGGVHERALAELRAGAKRGHWMWFVLPQLRGLGRSPTAERYGLASLAEARAYLADAELGDRLRACCAALLALPADASAAGVLGEVDALKLHSSMTLFARADPTDPAFPAVLERFFAGRADAATDRLLEPRIG